VTGLLKWRTADVTDRTALQTFACTEQATKRRIGLKKCVLEHPRMWEWDVQCKIRNLQPPYKLPVQMIVGEDAEGIGAVSVFEELDGAGLVELSFLALAYRLRFKGGGYADEMGEETWQRIEARALEQGVDGVMLVALVDEGNVASQKLCRRLGLIHTGMRTNTLQQWSGLQPLGELPDDKH
jgi:RimJ/RimL family protein N-acetyltransferase